MLTDSAFAEFVANNIGEGEAFWDFVWRISGENFRIAAAEGWSARAMTAAGVGETAFAGAMVVLPFVMFAGGCVALFYMPYKTAEDAFKIEETQSGYSQGLVAGLLEWDWKQLADRFGRHYIRVNVFDEEMNRIRVTAYNVGLRIGWSVAKSLTGGAEKRVLSAIRKVAKEPIPSRWTRLEQISYVIALAAAARRSGMIQGA